MGAGAIKGSGAYDLWAATYPPEPHNPLMRAEHAAMIEHWPELTGTCALDLAGGTGRYGRLLADRGARTVISLDHSLPMLQRSVSAGRIRGDMMRLPFPAGVFDFIVSGLAVGHAPDLPQWMREAARTLAPGGTLLYSDFHPDAAAAGMQRTFTDEHNRSHTVPHRCYEIDDHRIAAAGEQLTIDVIREVRVGIDLRESFSGSEAFYRRWNGLAVVLVVRARKGRLHAR